MASFLRRPSNTQANQPKKNIVRFGSEEPPVGAPKQPKKGSFVSLFSGGGGPNNQYYFDNGIDPLGRLSTDSVGPPPLPNPTEQQPTFDEGPKFWVDEMFPLTNLPSPSPTPSAELLARVKYFLSQKEPSALEKATHIALFAAAEGEGPVNAKLYRRFGDGLPVRLPGQKGMRKEDGQVPKTLRELLRAFLSEHDPGFLTMEGEAGLDEMLGRAAEYGLDSLEAELCRKYGFGLNGKKKSMKVFLNDSRSRDNSSFEHMMQAARRAEPSAANMFSPITAAKTLEPPPFAPPPALTPATNFVPSSVPQTIPAITPLSAPPAAFNRMEKAKSEKPQTLIELDEDDLARESRKPLVSPMSNNAAQAQTKPPMNNNTQAQTKTAKHDFFDDKSLRADLRAFYAKHDQKKLDAQKFEPIVQWAYKIGPAELNRRFEEKYGESLTQFVEDMQAGRPGVPPGPKVGQPKTDENGSELNSSACRRYHEAKPGKGFGVCTCGFSRVDHKHITSLLIPGLDEPRFNKAKPKVVLSKNPSGSSNSKSNIMAVPLGPSFPKDKASNPAPSVKVAAAKVTVIPVQPKFEVKAEGRDGPCNEYRLDLEGRSFGVCKCGWGRAEHNKAKQQVAWASNDD